MLCVTTMVLEKHQHYRAEDYTNNFLQISGLLAQLVEHLGYIQQVDRVRVPQRSPNFRKKCGFDSHRGLSG